MTTPDNTHDLYEAGIDAALHSLNRVAPAAGLEQRVMARLAQQTANDPAHARRRRFGLPSRMFHLSRGGIAAIATASAALLLLVSVAAWQMHPEHATNVDIASVAQEPASNVALPPATAAAPGGKDSLVIRPAAAERAPSTRTVSSQPSPLTQQEQMLLSLVRSVPVSELPPQMATQQNATQQTASSDASSSDADEADQPSASIAVADPAVADPAATNSSIETASSTESMN
ncbi:MAG: hypothetical protein ACYC46_11625 [Acidobacteriaceae bacterium]